MQVLYELNKCREEKQQLSAPCARNERYNASSTRPPESRDQASKLTYIHNADHDTRYVVDPVDPLFRRHEMMRKGPLTIQISPTRQICGK